MTDWTPSICHCQTSLNELAKYGQEGLALTWDATGRGFTIGEFRDLYGQECTIQESSSAEHEAIWFGVGGCRMHLTSDQVRGLIKVLRSFTREGDLRDFYPEKTNGE